MAGEYRDERGSYVWRTVGGHRIKIYTGQTLSEAMKESGKFGKKKKGIKKEEKEEYTFDEIEDEMSRAESYEDLYNAVDKIKDPKKRQNAIDMLDISERDGDDVDTAYSIASTEYVDPYRNDKNIIDTKMSLNDRELSKLYVAGGKNNLDKIKEAKDKAKADYIGAGIEWGNLYDKQKWNDPDSDQWHKDLDALRDRQIKSREEYKKQLTDYMKYASDEDLTWQDKVGMNNILMEDELNEYTRKNDPFGRNANNEAIHDGYYEIYRNNERRNAKLKENVKPDEPYEYTEAYAGYKDKVSKHGDHDKWSGKEYTNDEFMEHLTDANWHHERRMLEGAGLTNQELAYVKDHTTLEQWGADLDSKKTQKLIDEAKAKFRKPKSNVKTISKKEYDAIPNDYKGTLKDLVNTAEFRGENKEQLRKEYEAMGYDVDNDKTIMEYPSTLRPVKVKDDDYEYNLYKQSRENPDSINPMTEWSTDWEALDKKYRNRYKKETSSAKKTSKSFPRNMSKEIYEMDVDKGNAWSGNAVQKTASGEKFVSVRRNGPSQNSAEDIVREMTQRHPQLKAQISSNGNEIRFTLKDENTRTTSDGRKFDYTKSYTPEEISKLDDDTLGKLKNSYNALYEEYSHKEKPSDLRTRNGKLENTFNKASSAKYKVLNESVDREISYRGLEYDYPNATLRKKAPKGYADERLENANLQNRYAGTIKYLQQETDMDLEEILELLKKRGK